MIDSISDPVNEQADAAGGAVQRRRKPARGDARPTLDQLPPHSIADEQGVLGCALLAPADCMGLLTEQLKGQGEIFYDLRHRAIFNALREMYDAGTGIDLITVQGHLRLRGTLDEVGGVVYLSQLQDAVPSAANLSYYLSAVREKAKLRKMIQLCQSIVGKVYDYAGEVDKLLVDFEAEVSKLTESETPQTEEHIKQVISRVLGDMEEWHYARGSQQMRGLPTGVPGVYLDKILQGIRIYF